MSEKHSNISIFVPHIGCPNKCSFCNQRYITGTCKAPNADDVEKAVITAVKSKKYNAQNTEIAFFGGSFTAINRTYMLSLLEAASSFVKIGLVKGIRISTRPDAIDDEILMLLKEYNVTAIELGAQSFNNYVLKMNNRGHTAKDIENAAMLIRKHGFELGLQIMTGLYCDDNESLERTAKKIIEIKPDTVRIYPTVVLKNTYLGYLQEKGEYIAPTAEESAPFCARLLQLFEKEGIKVIKLGLHSSETVEGDMMGGAYHPAFRELCDGHIYLAKTLEKISDKDKNQQYVIYVNKKVLSKAKGQQKRNEKALKNKGFHCIIKGKENLEEFDIEVEVL